MDWDEVSAEWVSRFAQRTSLVLTLWSRFALGGGEGSVCSLGPGDHASADDSQSRRAVSGQVSRTISNRRSLASAEVADVLRVWEGLGYYSRARNLGLAAKMIVGEWGGQWRETARSCKLCRVWAVYGRRDCLFCVRAIRSDRRSQHCSILRQAPGADGRPAQRRRTATLWSLAERMFPGTDQENSTRLLSILVRPSVVSLRNVRSAR
ncbi:MAG: hypothetical protein CM1200mP2_45900 [Planctomycetaceae bacterium]|nr:MAG: hypothetical protein CM1200mP2_45900 [Planctomycetaceae bacterium]